jgi:predicted O-methyltransferase YrrM
MARRLTMVRELATVRDTGRDLAAALDLVESIEGWRPRDQAELLVRLAERVDREHAIVEIGNYRGRSTVALALGAKLGNGAQVYSVDPHLEFTGPRGGRFGREDQQHLYANLARAGVGALVSVVGLESRAVAESWRGPSVGLLFIDGDHHYEGVRADFAAWEPHLARGAIIAFDDSDFADVARAIAELERDPAHLVARGATGCIRWLQRRPG